MILADRGFDIAEAVGMLGAQVKIPAFTKGRKQLSAREIESTRKLASLRIHVERVISALTAKFTILNGIVPVEMLHVREGEDVTTLDKIVFVGCGVVNICDGIVL